MLGHADKRQKNRSKAAEKQSSRERPSSKADYQFVDSRPEAEQLFRLQEMANNSPQAVRLQAIQEMADNAPQSRDLSQLQAAFHNSLPSAPQPLQIGPQHSGVAQRQAGLEEEELQMKAAPAPAQTQAGLEEEELLQGKFAPAQRQEGLEQEELLQGKLASGEPPAQLQDDECRRENDTGLPDNLKAGIENISGVSLDNVNVHHNSAKPAQLQALAYTQGTDIHVGPGQEEHLPHEAWHVVQQDQGRVKPTMRAEGVAINDDEGLERVADVMGREAVAHGVGLQMKTRVAPVQRQGELEEEEPLQGRFATSESPARLQREAGPLVAAIGHQNETVVQRETTILPRTAHGIDSTRVTWESGGEYTNVEWIDTVDETDTSLEPTADYLNDLQRSVLAAARIAKVEMDPTDQRVMMYPRNSSHGVWQITRTGGGPPYWVCVGTVYKKGLILKTTKVKTKPYLAGIENLGTAPLIANRVFNNMQTSGLAYQTHGGTPDGVANGEKKGQCHAVNGGLGIVIQAALASRGVTAAVKKVDEGNPFMTKTEGYGNNVIKGDQTNIKKQKIGEAESTPYTDKAIKFDNHSWITVGGKVYDLIAGIVDGAETCVATNLTVNDEIDGYDMQGGGKLVKCTAKVKAPWTQAYEIQRDA